MKLNDITKNLNRGLGITRLTPVQQRMATLSNSPAIRLVAPTGSGKTVAFVTQLLLALRSSAGRPQAFVIVPSRELARQVFETVRIAASGFLRTTACYGGHPFADEVSSLTAGVDIVVATPGRLLDHLQRSTIDGSGVTQLVLDEYDKSLELGFEREMKRIVRSLPAVKSYVLTSATEAVAIPPYLPAAGRFTVVTPQPGEEQGSSDDGVAADKGSLDTRPRFDIIKVVSYTRDKLQVATELVSTFGLEPTIVFVNHRESAERVAAHLRREGYAAGLYHGALDQTGRENALEMFANGSTPVMVATDLAARGLDIAGVSHIVHYNLPLTADAWTHRNGRTSRMGAEGDVYFIAGEEETLPEFIAWDRDYQPPHPPLPPVEPQWATLLLSLGRREKISKGDILGFLTANSPLGGGDVGRISLRDHSALVAVSRGMAEKTLADVNKAKIKNQRVKVTLL